MSYIPTNEEINAVVQRYKNYERSKPEKYEELKREYLNIFNTGFHRWDPIDEESWRFKNRPGKSLEYFQMVVEHMNWRYE